MAEKKEREEAPTNEHGGMNPEKKKKVLIGAGLAGVLVLGYLWYRNRSSSSSSATTATPSGSGITTYLPSGSGAGSTTDTTGNTGGSSQPINVNVTGSPINFPSSGGGGSPITAPLGRAAGHPIKKPVHKVKNTGGKTHLHNPVVKPKGHTGGAIIRRSGTTATARPVHKAFSGTVKSPTVKSRRPMRRTKF